MCNFDLIKVFVKIIMQYEKFSFLVPTFFFRFIFWYMDFYRQIFIIKTKIFIRILCMGTGKIIAIVFSISGNFLLNLGKNLYMMNQT